jgi:hypothetical protein
MKQIIDLSLTIKRLTGACVLIIFYAFMEENRPAVFINNGKTEVTDGMYINCLTINDLSCNVSFREEMNSYDQLKLELHRFGDTTDIIGAEKIFIPTSKEFQKKYMNKSDVKFRILAEEDEFSGSDLEANTHHFVKNSTVNMVFCKSHDLKQCSWYVILRGYKKTGEKTRFDEDVMDKGKDLSGKSVWFRSWEDKRK